MSIRVPYAKSVHGEEEIQAVLEVLKSSTQIGARVLEFESEISKLFAKKYGVMVNSGSSANELALEIAGLPENSEVITPVLTFSTTVAPIVRKNLVPVFIDVEEGTYNIDHNHIESMISSKTSAIMIPNLIGNIPDWDIIKAVAVRHNLIVIEDSADTLRSSLRNSLVGERSDISTTSFYGSHVINGAGNGGMVCCNRKDFFDEARLLRSWGRSSSLFEESEKIENRFNVSVDNVEYDSKFVFEKFGYNFEPSEISAAFGLIQLKRLNSFIEKRFQYFKNQYEFFKKYEEWFVLPKQIPESSTAWLAFPLTIREGAPFKRREMQVFLEERNIQTRTVFTGNILRQPLAKYIKQKRANDVYPEADRVMEGGILLACHHGLSEEMLAHVHQSFEDFSKRFL